MPIGTISDKNAFKNHGSKVLKVETKLLRDPKGLKIQDFLLELERRLKENGFASSTARLMKSDDQLVN